MSGKPHFVGDIKSVGQDFQVEGVFYNRFKRPCSLKVVVEKADNAASARDTVVSGDRFDVWYTMSALAEIAWNMGWRPAGLTATVDHLVKNYQIPGHAKVGRNVHIPAPKAPKAPKDEAEPTTAVKVVA